MNNRIIKFRARDLTNNSWIYSDHLKTMAWFWEMLEKNEFKYEINQFTGLLDTNGREIYEGDVINTDGDYITDEIDENGNYLDLICVVYYCLPQSRFAITSAEDFKNGYDLEHAWIVSIGALGKVIGNIYENPELLSGS